MTTLFLLVTASAMLFVALQNPSRPRRVAQIVIAASFFALAFTTAAGAVAGSGSDRYALRRGNGPAVVVVQNGCLRAEDSAAHLTLVAYGDGRAVYTCDPNSF